MDDREAHLLDIEEQQQQQQQQLPEAHARLGPNLRFVHVVATVCSLLFTFWNHHAP